MLKGETIASGAPKICPECKIKLRLGVLYSLAGYYIGVWCLCGPYSRESIYYKRQEDAEKDLKKGKFKERF